MAVTQTLGSVTLVTGPEEFLAERAVTSVRAEVRTVDPEAELSETTGDQVTASTLDDLSAPSLFSSTRCVVVRALENVPEDAHDALVAYASDPAPDVAIVLVHGGGQKGTGLLTKLRKCASVREIKSTAVTARELSGFVANELRSHKVRIDPEASDLLIAAVGQNLRALSAAAHQLANDYGAAPITAAMVKTYFGGRAEAKSFTIADLTLTGQAGKALEELRWGLATGLAPVLVTSAIAAGLRSMVQLKAASRGQNDAALAGALKVPPFKIRILRDQARGWESEMLAQAIVAVAQADADIKGRASDAAYALEKLVMAVAALRKRG